MAATTYVVSQYTAPGNSYGGAGMGGINSKTYTSATEAAKDYLTRSEMAGKTYEYNREMPAGERKGILTPEIHALNSDGTRRALTQAEHSTLKSAITSLKENPSFLKTMAREVGDSLRRIGIFGKAAGAVLAGGMAMAGGANAAEVGQAAMNAAVPGTGTLVLGEGPSHGRLCKAFGEATGAIAQGGAYAAGFAATGVATVAAVPLSGPGAVAVAGLGSYVTVKGADGAEKLGTAAGEAGCRAVTNFVQKLGM